MNQEAIAIVQNCLDTQDPYLDLGRLGLRDADFAQGTELDKLLRQCTHLQTLVLSNSWYWWDANRRYKEQKSRNSGTRNQLAACPPALMALTGLVTLMLAGEYDNKWGMADMGFVTGMKDLKVLNLGYNQISEIGGLDGLSALQVLLLYNNRISEIRELEGLSALQQLYLSGNQISEIGGLEGLSALQQLYLSGNQISEIRGLAGLSSLQQLDLRGNRISEIRGLDGLSSLQRLDLDNNKISEIGGLEGLSSLQQLDLSGNQISEIGGLEGLSSLQQLGLSSNKISEIRGLEGLSSLQVLNLYNNQISEIGGLEGLSALQRLNLESNRISEIGGLEGLSSLQRLNMESNCISEIHGLDGLSALQQLNLTGNRISEIGGLEGLSSLQQLELRSNPSIIQPFKTLSLLSNLQEILLDEKTYLNCQPYTELIETRNIPVRAERLIKGEVVLLTGSPIFPPPIIIAKGEVAIIAYFESLKKGTQPLNEVKVLLVGDGAAGKTSLVKQLIGKAFNQKESQTHGIQIQDSAVTVDEEKIKVHYWDFGGQEIMHATHQFFLTKDCVYVLVLDGRRDERPEYWLKHITIFGGNAPVLVVLNKCEDNRSYDIEQQELKKKFSNVQDYYKLSCKTQEGVVAFTKALHQQLLELPFRKTPFSPDWTNVKELLRTMPDPYISYTDYYKICDERLVIDSMQQQTLLDYLNSLGIILHFDQLKQYDTQVLNPLWLTQAVYRIVNSPIVAKQQGEFTESQLYDILNDEHFINTIPAIEEDNDLLTKIKRWFGFEAKTKKAKPILYDGNIRLSFIAKVMQQFELSYCFDEVGGKYIIPDLLPVEPTVKINYGEYTLRFSTDFYFLPPALLPRFMVQTHLHIQDAIRWRNGVMLNAEGVFDAVAIVRVDKENKRLDIYVKGPEERELLAYIRSVLQGLYNGYEGLKEPGRVKEWLFLPNSDVTVELDEIEGLRKLKQERYYSGKTIKDYNLTDLKASVENPAYPLEKEAQPVKIFISYSRTKKKFREELVTKLHLLTKSKDNFIELWVDEQLNPGVAWEKEIDEALHYCDIVICLLSDEYLASKICMYEAEKAKENGKIIYPILVNTCAWQDTFFKQINGYFAAPIEQVTKSKRPENWQKVYEGVVKLIRG